MNPNLFIWTSDWHVVSNDSETGMNSMPTEAEHLAQHIASLQPAGAIDTGDCKDHYGPANEDELDQYLAKVVARLPWATLNPGLNAQHPILPGNHDELNDYTVAGPDFSPFDSRFWEPPYHWTCDWAAPQVRFIGFHARIVHVNDVLPYPGFFIVEPAERAWLDDELAALPDGWQAIVCSHPPLNPAFGNNIDHRAWLAGGGTETQTILRNHAPRVAAYLNGHRHANMNTNVLDGITHFNGPGCAYTQGNGWGAWAPIDYDPATRTLTFRLLRGPNYLRVYPPLSDPPLNIAYTPIVIQLPALPGDPPPPEPTVYTFQADTVLAGAGPLSGSPVTVAGTFEVA